MLVRRNIARKLELGACDDNALVDQGHAARAAWNLLHAFMTGTSRSRRPSLRQADEAIRQGRKDLEWLAVLPAQAAQQVLKTYKQAWENCFKRGAGPPNYKARLRTKHSIDVPQASRLDVKRVSRHHALVGIPGLGRVRFRWSGPIPGVGKEPGRITGARLVRGPFGWSIVFRCEVEIPDPTPHQGTLVGVDRGVNVSLALSDGNDRTHGPWLGDKERERLLRLERKAARQRRARKPGTHTSNRLQRTYDQIAKARATSKRRRRNWQHQITTALAREYSIIGVEALRLANMTRSAKGTAEKPGKNVAQKSGLNRVLLEEGHGQCLDLLMYKVEARGGAVVQVPAQYTSQTCSSCGHRDAASRNGVSFVCTGCGFTCHADTNAACNVEDLALDEVLKALLLLGVPVSP